MSTSDALEQVILAQGRARTVAIATTIASWGVHVPATALLVKYWARNMQAVFFGTMLGYIALFAVCVDLLRRSQWVDMSNEARARSEVAPASVEATPKLDTPAESA